MEAGRPAGEAAGPSSRRRAAYRW